MIGAIIGDIVGSVYEFDNIKTKDFPFFSPGCEPTDDSVMSLAVAKSILEAEDLEALAGITVANMVWLGNRYPHAGYGGRFYQWLKKGKYTPHPGPYNSFGNGSAMRASPCGFAAKTLKEALTMARVTAEVTHNHPEGIKGAEAVACAVFLARTGSGKEELRAHISREFGYDLSRSCDEIRPGYHHVESCQETVPEAITAFLEGNDFEDVIRTAVSLGGDCDTLTCIAGSIAEAFYGVPAILEAECRARLPEDMLEVLRRFDIARGRTEKSRDAKPVMP